MKARVKSGFAFHVHHDVLTEFCTNYQERVDYIKNSKPKDEVELRLKLFKLIPTRRLPRELAEAQKAYNEAWKAYLKAWKAYLKAWKARGEAEKAYLKAWKARGEAEKAYNEEGKARGEEGKAYLEAWKAYLEAGKARDEALKARELELIKLHQELCPNCPWSEEKHTIFPNK